MMNVSASTFLVAHNAALTAGNNMPATFITDYTTDAALFASKMQQFIGSQQQFDIDIHTKQTANNEVYTQLINLFKDGQQTFRHQPEIRRQFVFEKVLALIVQHHPSPKNNTASETLSPEAAQPQ